MHGADRYAEWAGHLLFATLLGVGLANVIADDGRDAVGGLAVAAAGAAAMAAWYLVGAVAAARDRRDHAAVWVLVLVAGWIGLVVVSADFVWIAFVLAMLVWHLVPRPVAIGVEVLIAATAVGGVAVHTGFSVGGVVGPLIGVATAVGVTEAFGRIGAMVLERDRLVDDLLATREQLAVTEREAGVLAERERLGGEIHDGTGQSLASIIMLLRSATAPDTPDAQRDAQTRTALDTAQTALAQSRRFLRGLDGPVGPADGLSAALGEQAARLTDAGVDCAFHEHGAPVELPDSMQVALLRTAQEALRNIERHANASAAAVTLTHLPGEVHLDVVDDGVGLGDRPAGVDADGHGFGLRAMTSRIDQCGGELTVESAPGDGTAIHVSLPVGSVR